MINNQPEPIIPFPDIPDNPDDPDDEDLKRYTQNFFFTH